MYNTKVRPEIMQAFIDYADIMTEEDFQLNYFATDEEMLVLTLSVENFFAERSDFEEYKKRIASGDLLNDDTWWKIKNDLF
jgi:hypothetical protein